MSYIEISVITLVESPEGNRRLFDIIMSHEKTIHSLGYGIITTKNSDPLSFLALKPTSIGSSEELPYVTRITKKQIWTKIQIQEVFFKILREERIGFCNETRKFSDMSEVCLAVEKST